MEGRREVRRDQSLVNARRLQTLEEKRCFLPRNGLQIRLDNLLRIKMRGAFREVVS